MSVAGISSNFSAYNVQSVQTQMQQLAQEFQQLGEDLQSGNLSAAQSEFAQLQQTQSASGASSTQSNTSVSQLFKQLSQDLQSGNLSAAQKDYTSIQQDFQNQTSKVHHHHPHGAGNGGEIMNLFQQLGQDLQSGNLSSAQQAYNTLMQDLPQISQSTGGSSSKSPLTSNSSVSLIA